MNRAGIALALAVSIYAALLFGPLVARASDILHDYRPSLEARR